MKESNIRGVTFEQRVASVLDALRDAHPKLVSVRQQPTIRLHSEEIVRPDFELRYDSGDQKDARLIECQSRKRSSSEIIHKIRHIKSLSSRNRFMFVYEDPDYLSSATKNSLTKDGIKYHSFSEFCAFLDRLGLKLRGVQIASLLAERGYDLKKPITAKMLRATIEDMHTSKSLSGFDSLSSLIKRETE